MKLLLILAMSILIPISSICQDEDNDFQTIFKKKEDSHLRISGFGGPIMMFSAIENDFAHMMGGGAALIIGNTFIGGYGMGKTNKTPFKYNNDYNLNYGHGGLMFGFVLGYRRPVHLSVSSLMGWGNISQSLDSPDYNTEEVNSNPIFVITPIAELEFNFSKYFIVGAGISTSYVTGRGITDTSYTTNDFLKPSVYLSFKFGWFD